LANDSPGEKLGKWYEEQYTSSTFVIFKDNNSYFLRTIYKSGQISDVEMTRSEIPSGVKYIYKDGGYNGEYFVIDKSGNLGLYNSKGKNFTTAKKIS